MSKLYEVSTKDLIDMANDVFYEYIIEDIEELSCKKYELARFISLIESGELDLTKDYLVYTEYFENNTYDSKYVSLYEDELRELLIEELVRFGEQNDIKII